MDFILFGKTILVVNKKFGLFLANQLRKLPQVALQTKVNHATRQGNTHTKNRITPEKSWYPYSNLSTKKPKIRALAGLVIDLLVLRVSGLTRLGNHRGGCFRGHSLILC